MRDVPLRLLQMLSDRAPQADDRHFLDAVTQGECLADSGPRAGRDKSVEILLGDPAGRAGGRYELQFDAEIPGAPPDGRRRERLLSRNPCCCRRGAMKPLSRAAGEGGA